MDKAKDEAPRREPRAQEPPEEAAPDQNGQRKDDGAPPEGGKAKPKKPSPLKNPKVLIIGGVVVAVLLVGGLLYWLHARHYQSTDDAFIDVHIVRLAAQVPGQVMRVTVDDNAFVRAGQRLVEIDASTAQAALAQAVAQRGQALAQIGQAEAQIGVSKAAYRQAQDQAAAADAQAKVSARDAARLQGLQASTPRAVAAEQVDQTSGQARQAAKQRDAALRQADGAAAQVRAAQTQIAGAQATLKAAQATIDANQITLGRTAIAAPVDGYVAQKQVAAGGYVQPGQQLMAIVPTQMWVTANFKETQLAHMRPGQPVDLKIDACPERLKGHVVSIQRGAGQAFALLPSENAAGNYVKVVQRVPVKIVFDHPPQNCPIGPGLSVQPRVKVR